MCYAGINMFQRERLGKVSYGDTVAKPQRKKFYAESKVSLVLPTLYTSGNGSDLTGADMATPLLTDQGYTHQLIACKRACT